MRVEKDSRESSWGDKIFWVQNWQYRWSQSSQDVNESGHNRGAKSDGLHPFVWQVEVIYKWQEIKDVYWNGGDVIKENSSHKHCTVCQDKLIVCLWSKIRQKTHRSHKNSASDSVWHKACNDGFFEDFLTQPWFCDLEHTNLSLYYYNF